MVGTHAPPPYLQNLFIGLPDGVLQGGVPLPCLLCLPLGLLHLVSEPLQPPPDSGELPLVLLHLALLLHLLRLQRQDLAGEEGESVAADGIQSRPQVIEMKSRPGKLHFILLFKNCFTFRLD